jgi:hypothetical protein
MKTSLKLDISYDQVLYLVKQLPNKEKLKLSKELEKEGIHSKLTKILSTFKTNQLSLATINKEVEIVRQQIYESQKS